LPGYPQPPTPPHRFTGGGEKKIERLEDLLKGFRRAAANTGRLCQHRIYRTIRSALNAEVGAPISSSAQVKPMSRVSIKSKDDLPAELKPLWDKMTTYGAFENQAGVMAHRPPIFKHIWSLLVDLADEAIVSKRHLELALVTVSLLNRCDYCVSHHAPKLAIQGVSERGAERLLEYKDHPELDAVDRLVVEYAIAVTNNWNTTRDEVFIRLRQHFSEAQIVELTWRIALCGAFNRFNDVLQLDLEQGVAVRDAAE
jgi:uncharacterized peroxidase-related enzyme